MKKILSIAILFCLCVGWAWARDLIIAGIPEEPNRWVANGKIVGIDPDVIDYVMKKLGIPYKIELVSSSARLEANAKENPAVYDMVFTYSYTADRDKYLFYPKESHISFNWNFFYLKENEGKFVFSEYKDLAKWTIGFTKGMSYSDDFLKAIKEVPLKIDEITTNEQQLDKLLAKRFDLVPLNTKATLYEAQKLGVLDKISYLPKPIKDKDYFNTFVRASDYPGLTDVAARYDEVLKQMKKDGSLAKILAKYGIK
jgi:polar amino acid transport system substrate-binding protein